MQVIKASLTWISGRGFVRNVAVVVGADGVIEDVLLPEDAAAADARVADAEVKELPNEALIPGLVNCHSHAFQRGLRGLGEVYPLIGGAGKNEHSFWTWRDEMYKLVGRMTSDEFYAHTRACFGEMRASGITSVGEFHYFHHSSGDSRDFAFDDVVIRAAKDAGVRLVLLNAFYGRGGFDGTPLSASQCKFKTDSFDEYAAHMDQLAERVEHEPNVSLGVVAHSLRAVGLDDFKKLRAYSLERGIVFHMHIEEQPKEVEACREAHAGKTPMDLVLDNVTVDGSLTAVHCNHTNSDLLKRFTDLGGRVCICPLTEGNLGDGVIETPSACGGSICIGTDCNARIDMLEELRWLEYSQRLSKLRRGMAVESSPACADQKNCAVELFRYATDVGAGSLGLPVGCIEKGKFADFATIDLSSPVLSGLCNPNMDDALLAAVIFGASSSSVIHSTCVGGVWNSAPN